MRKSKSFLYHISVFIIAQIAWFMLLGIWIYWYVSNYIILEQVGDQLSAQFDYNSFNLLPFIGGIVLLIGISVGMSLTFRHLNVQLKLHKFYDNFIANVSHELKSPLSSIQLYLETLISRDVPPEKQKEFFELMTKDSNRLKYLIDTILEISALDRRSIAHEYHIYDAQQELVKLLKDSMRQFKLPEDSLQIVGNIEAKIVIDLKAFKIVFDNLVDNAVKYSTDSPRLTLRLKKNVKKITVELSDTGIGLPAVEENNVFNKFHRVYNREVPNVKGTGLGLYWTKEIIKSHGGSVSASSREQEIGTTIKIELPVYKSYKVRFINKLLKRTREFQKSRE